MKMYNILRCYYQNKSLFVETRVIFTNTLYYTFNSVESDLRKSSLKFSVIKSLSCLSYLLKKMHFLWVKNKHTFFLIFQINFPICNYY